MARRVIDVNENRVPVTQRGSGGFPGAVATARDSDSKHSNSFSIIAEMERGQAAGRGKHRPYSWARRNTPVL
jgi:hypothetical protein